MADTNRQDGTAATANSSSASNPAPADDSGSGGSNPPSEPQLPIISASYDDYYKRLHEWMWAYNWQKFCWEQQQREARDRLCWQQWSMALAAQLQHARTPHTNMNGAQLRVFPQVVNAANAQRIPVPQAAQNHPQIFVGAIGPNNQMDTSWKGFKTAPVAKRVVAEIIDIVILMLIKILLTYTVFDDLFMLDLNKYQNFLDGETEITADMALDLMSDLAVLEFAHRLISCLYEVIMTLHGFEHAGATFGKFLMGLRVVSCTEFILLDAMILVKPGETPNMKQAIVRAFLKNYSWAMFLPLSLTAFLNKERRCTYDTMCKCIVVEVRDPVIRRFVG